MRKARCYEPDIQNRTCTSAAFASRSRLKAAKCYIAETNVAASSNDSAHVTLACHGQWDDISLCANVGLQCPQGKSNRLIKTHMPQSERKNMQVLFCQDACSEGTHHALCHLLTFAACFKHLCHPGSGHAALTACTRQYLH